VSARPVGLDRTRLYCRQNCGDV